MNIPEVRGKSHFLTTMVQSKIIDSVAMYCKPEYQKNVAHFDGKAKKFHKGVVLISIF